MGKHFRKRVATNDEDDEEERRLALEEVKLIQKQRERRSGIAALPGGVAGTVGAVASPTEKADAEGEKEELVLQDTFAQETAVNVEDPNMLKYVEQELSKKRGRQELDKEAEEHRPEDDLYVIPDHLKVRRRNAEESSTQWTTGIAEVQLPIEYKLKNIEETEAAKRQLQDKPPFVGRQRSSQSSNIPSSYSADFFHRGREAAEKEKEKEKENQTSSSTKEAGSGRRQAATDEIMLERFRKRERSRMMRR